jgi:hypothetical protein
MAGFLTSFGLGFVYFVGAIPAGVAAHTPLWLAAVAAWEEAQVKEFIQLANGYIYDPKAQ